jgi:hypothetical protein
MEHREPPEMDSGGSVQEEARRNAPCEEEAVALPVRGDVYIEFVALAFHTSSRENEVQPVVSGAMRHQHRSEVVERASDQTGMHLDDETT